MFPQWNQLKNAAFGRRGFTLIGVILSVAILAVTIAISGYLLSSAYHRYENVSASTAVLNIEDEVKLAAMGEIKTYLKGAFNSPNCQPAKLALALPPTVNVPSGLSLTTLTAATEAALDANPPDPSVKTACGKAGAKNFCGTGGVYLSSDDLGTNSNGDISAASVYCFCIQISVPAPNAANASIAKVAALSPIYAWFKYRVKEASTGINKTCLEVGALPLDGGTRAVANQLDYVIYWPSQVKDTIQYNQQPGSYLTGGL